MKGQLRASRVIIGAGHDVLDRAQFREQVVELEDEAEGAVAEAVAPAVGQVVDPQAVELDGAGVGRVEQAEQMEERTLARAAGPDDGDELAALDLQVDPAEYRHFVPALAVRLLEAARGQVECHRS